MLLRAKICKTELSTDWKGKKRGSVAARVYEGCLPKKKKKFTKAW